MVLGYPYEQVQSDRRERYGYFDDRTSWWEHYVEDEGRTSEYRSLDQLNTVLHGDGTVLGLLVMHNRDLEKSHVVVVDEWGVVDPADGSPDHAPLDHYALLRRTQGFVFDDDFLAVTSSPVG